MTPWRMVATGIIGLILLALGTWQQHRERLVRGCLETGGVWDGRGCNVERARPIILRRDLERS